MTNYRPGNANFHEVSVLKILSVTNIFCASECYFRLNGQVNSLKPSVIIYRVVTSRFFSDLSTLNSLSDRNRLQNRFFLQLSLTILSSLSTAILLKQGRVSQFLSGNLAFLDAHTTPGVTYKRIDSLKKELTIQNSFEKELIESILQLSTHDSLPL